MNTTHNHITYKVVAITMMIILAWFTVCMPIVFKAKKLILIEQNDDSNPLTNSTEEKNPSGINLGNEEYLHENHSYTMEGMDSKGEHFLAHEAEYISFHSDMLVPPPNC